MTSTAIARLRHANWLADPALQKIFATLDPARTRAVGGLVRDTLLGMAYAASDIDLATEFTPDAVVERAGQAGIAVYPTGIAHGTVTLRIDALTAEVTTLRRDVETDGRHAVVQFGTDWSADAARRDFTINALYASADGTLFDPLGGLGDCLAGRVRFIGEPSQRIAEDRLRVFRFFRFSASHGHQQFDRDGLAACALAAGTLARLSAERVGTEIRRMLSLDKIAVTLRALSESGVLVLDPALLDQLERYERYGAKLDGRLALIIATDDAKAVQARWRLSNEIMASAQAVLDAAKVLGKGGSVDEIAYRYGDVVQSAIAVAAALSQWDEGHVTQLRAQKPISGRKFPVNGADLQRRGLTPGKALGEELERLENIWIESGFALDREDLLEQARL